jgi:DNA-binding NarL/FixJ family response regulator
MKIKFNGKQLTSRQVDVLKLIGEGYSNSEISNELCLSPRTIETHVYKIKHLISQSQNVRLGERKLVILAKEMLEGYKEYLKLCASH